MELKNKVLDLGFSTSMGKTAFKATMSDGIRFQIIYDGDILVSAFPILR